MSTLLSQQQTDALRSIGDGALVLFAISMVDGNFPGRITKAAELLPYLYPTYKDVRKLTTQLNALSASGRLAQNGSGYVLLDGGRALLLEMSGNALPENVSESLAQSPALAAGTLIEAQVTEIEDVSSIKGEISARALRAHEMTLKKEEEEGLILKDTDSSTSKTAQNARSSETPMTDADTIPEVEIAPGVTTERILIATSMLEDFGDDGVFLHGLDIANIHPREALGWIAQAYNQRAKLGSPAGLVYSRLKDAKKPKARSKYREGWESYLSEDYLRQIGWLSLDCECGKEFNSLEELEAHQAMLFVCEYGCSVRVHTAEELEAHHKSHEAAVTVFTALPSDHIGARAWDLVITELQNDIPKASFDTWVRDAVAVGFDSQTLSIAVRNAYVSDWLKARLEIKIVAMLSNYLHKNIAIDFVVGTIAEEE